MQLKHFTLLALFVLMIFLAAAPASHAQTVTAASCSQTDVTNAWSTVTPSTKFFVIPSGNCTWTGSLTMTVPTGSTNLTIQGGTTVTCSGTPGTSNYLCTYTDGTILTDSSGGSAAIWNMNVGSGTVRITGMSFFGGAVPAGTNKTNGFLTIGGTTQNFRLDHCHFLTRSYTLNGQPYNTGGGMTFLTYMGGVIDHLRFESGGVTNGIRYYPENGGVAGSTGYSQASTLGGSTNVIFVESNYWEQGGFINDCDQGGRMVIRYNWISATRGSPNNSGGMQTHVISQGYESHRGCRQMEQYNNYQLQPTPSIPAFAAADINAGAGVRFNNILTTGWNNDIVFQYVGRELSANNCGGGAGNAGACKAPPNGFGYCGIGSSGVTSVWDGNTNSTTGYPCLDDVGRGQSDLLTGSFPSVVDSVTGTATWPNQKREPIYVWNDQIAAGNVCNIQTFNGVAPVANKHYYCQVGTTPNSSPTSPFNGTAGVGWGTLVNRPTTCTAGPGGTFDTSPTGSYGVGYFATDANGGNGELYVCTATNTWTGIYQPYTYPHPLVSGSVTLNPSTQSFGSVNVNSSSSPATFTVSNGSANSMTAVSISNSGTNASEFTIGSNSCGSTVAANSSCTFTETFTPQAVGSKSATVTLSFSGGDSTSPKTSTLSGSSGVPAFSTGNLTSCTAVSCSVNLSGTSFKDLLVVGVFVLDSTAVSSITDTQGNTFTLVSGPTTWSTNNYVERLYYAKNIAGGSDTITVSLASSKYHEIYAYDYTGMDNLSPLDASATAATGTGTTATSGNVTTTNANDVLFGFFQSDAGVNSAGSGYIGRPLGAQTDITGEDKAVSTTGTYSATMNISASAGWVGFLAAFKGFNASGPVTLAPTSQNFGTINVGSSSTATTFTLTNSSSVSATSVTISNGTGNPGDFVIGGSTCGATLVASASCTFTETFTPTATGARATTLTVNYAGGDGLTAKSASLTGTGSQTLVANPVISPPGGSYSQMQVITITDATPGATICYTLDGTTPTTNAMGTCTGATLTYSAPFQQTSTVTVTAIGTKNGLADSGVTTATLTIVISAPAPQFTIMLPGSKITCNTCIVTGTQAQCNVCMTQ